MYDPKPHLLFIEDDIDIANMFKIYFASMAEVAVAARAEEGLALYSTDPFDLIIVDLAVRDFDEYGFMKTIRAAGNNVPILFLTQKDGPPSTLQELGIDEDDYIAKPFDIEELKVRIQRILNRLAGDSSTDAPPPERKKKD